MYDTQEEETKKDDGEDIYFSVRKVLQAKLPSFGIAGTVYLTEKGNMYLTKDDGSLMPLAGSENI